MILKGIGLTTHIDRHNCKFTKEALENATDGINNSKYVPSVGIDHDHSLMPIGKVIKGEIVPLEDGEFGTQVTQEVFDFLVIKDPDNKSYYFAESKIDSRPFADTQPEDIKKLKIDIDPVNFNRDDFNQLKKYLIEECSADSTTFMRKALIPDPEIVITLIGGTLLYLTGKKTLEKLADKISTDLANSYDNIKKAINKIVEKISTKKRPVTYVFRESDKYIIELILITNDVNKVFDALQPGKIDDALEKIDAVKVYFNADIAKIQLLYDNINDEWEFNYLTTLTGQAIGTEKCYNKTAKVLEKVIEGVKAQVSLTGTSLSDSTQEKKNE